MFRRGGGKFCSISCATTYRNLESNPAKDKRVREKISANHADVSGKSNPMYGRRGEMAPGYIDGRNGFTGETYRKVLLASGREMICASCGARGNLHAHHVDGDHKNNALSNLVWLCPKCHNTVAHRYERDAGGKFVSSKLNERVVFSNG